ncbi:MAG: hypothetical protein GEV03_04385 [Streptosporangiales bacterium]|nr:hypothetical protein [Streptosporangiales bacterium]
MSQPESIDAMMRELRRFHEELPRWADALARQQSQEVRGESTGRSVRASCTASGEVARVEIDTYFLRAAGPGRVDAAILEALQDAQAAAYREVAAHQETLRFMGLPVGEVLSGKRSLSDLLPAPPSFSPAGSPITDRSDHRSEGRQ